MVKNLRLVVPTMAVILGVGADSAIAADEASLLCQHRRTLVVSARTDRCQPSERRILSTSVFTGVKGEGGSVGAPGQAGPKGDKGDTGAVGPQGPIGLTGAAGAKGDKGDTGAVGPQGPIGLTGPAGAKGDKGDTGAEGPQGQTGLTGPAGAKGDKGDTGAEGPQGPKGTDGTPGTDGKDGIDGTPGANGKDGAPGTINPAGCSVVPSANTEPAAAATATVTCGTNEFLLSWGFEDDAANGSVPVLSKAKLTNSTGVITAVEVTTVDAVGGNLHTVTVTGVCCPYTPPTP